MKTLQAVPTFVAAPSPDLDQPERPASFARTLTSTIGHWGVERVEGLGKTARSLQHTLYAVRDVSTWWPELSPQAMSLGVRSLPIALYIAVFTGIVLSLLASYSFTGAVPEFFVGTLVEKTMTMELAPVLTGLALAGRVGANIAAELGTMRVTEQIDALETLAYDPHAYLVVHRVLAGTIMFPVIVGIAMVVGIGAGWVCSTVLLDMTTSDFTKGLRLFFETFDVQYGLVKAASFGTVITWIGCMQGMNTRGGAQGVGAAATSAVVYSAVTILVLDALFAMFWLLGHKS